MVVHDASRTSDQDGPRTRAPHEEARSEQPEAEKSARTASERDQGAGEVRSDPRGSPVPDGRRRTRAAT
jgi:hypothetical protein